MSARVETRQSGKEAGSRLRRASISSRWALLLLESSFAFLPRESFSLAASPAPPAIQRSTGESVGDAICRLIETAARAHALPVGFLTRLIWQESAFRATAVSAAGAQGIAQFMPKTADERGLSDPFDPEQAIPKAASLLAELSQRFGNLGLAAAAYNGGATRVANWLAGHGELAAETRNYVLKITGRSVEDWASDGKTATIEDKAGDSGKSCLQVAITIRRVQPAAEPDAAPFAPWGIQLAGSFSKAAALASFARARHSYSAVLGDVRPLIIGTRLLSRGTRPYYRVRVGEPNRAAADLLCSKIMRIGGACVVLAN
jgi:hypothetical protein